MNPEFALRADSKTLGFCGRIGGDFRACRPAFPTFISQALRHFGKAVLLMLNGGASRDRTREQQLGMWPKLVYGSQATPLDCGTSCANDGSAQLRRYLSGPNTLASSTSGAPPLRTCVEKA
jgi:hypothetical protein